LGKWTAVGVAAWGIIAFLISSSKSTSDIAFAVFVSFFPVAGILAVGASVAVLVRWFRRRSWIRFLVLCPFLLASGGLVWRGREQVFYEGVKLGVFFVGVLVAVDVLLAHGLGSLIARTLASLRLVKWRGAGGGLSPHRPVAIDRATSGQSPDRSDESPP